MKRCPECNRTYADDNFTFCLADGALLSAPYDPQATQRLPNSRITNQPTEVLPASTKSSGSSSLSELKSTVLSPLSDQAKNVRSVSNVSPEPPENLREELLRDIHNKELRKRYLINRTIMQQNKDYGRARKWVVTYVILFGLLGLVIGMIPGHAAVRSFRLSGISALLLFLLFLLVQFMGALTNRLISAAFSWIIAGAIGGVIWVALGNPDSDVGGSIGGAIGGIISAIRSIGELAKIGPLPAMAYLTSVKKARKIYQG